jgi:anti-sigma factor RsiW
MLSQVPPTDCMRAREGASARLDGELSQLESAWLDGHLAGCADCRVFAADAGAVAGALRGADLEPLPQTLFTPVGRDRRRVGGPVAAAVAALVVAAAAGSSALVGRLVADRSAGSAATVAAPSQLQVDPVILALLRGDLRHDSGSKSVPI